ncbi:hypothetical protein HYT23_02465 [Candidatus Pacearchaeota archaeon]|nr:hypothetical protein [Candidatus Pacearchaeota archaeon]
METNTQYMFRIATQGKLIISEESEINSRQTSPFPRRYVGKTFIDRFDIKYLEVLFSLNQY